MRNIVVSEFVSLDNVMQAPGGAEEDTEGGFTHGGWTWPFWHDDIGAHFFEAMSQSDALLLGRKTWQIHGGAFEPMPAGDPFGDAMNTMPKYVASRTLDTATWNATIIKGEVADKVRELKQEDGGDLLIGGSGQLIDYLTRHDLIDEYRMMVVPIVLGNGTKRLFNGVPQRTFMLVESLTLPKGVVINTYHPAAPASE